MSQAVTVRYTPRGAARELFSCRSPEVVISGPAGTGKSLAALFRLHLAALKVPGIRCLIARKTATSLTSTTLVTFESKVIQEALTAGVVTWFGGNARSPAAYRYANGSRVVVGGLDKPERVLSSEYDLVFVDEATELSETDWEILATRLRNNRLPWQQQIAACNPDRPTHWIKARADRGSATFLESRHRDNPLLYSEDGELTAFGQLYMTRLESLTGVRRLRLKDGLWAAAEGVIFEEYDPAVHLIDRFDIPAEWPRFWVVDFGFTNPFVMQWWAEDPDGRLFLYREIYRTRRLVEDHARTALEAVTDPKTGEWTEPRPTAIICDHDAEDRATLEKHLGIRTTAARKSVSDGIQAVQSRLKVAGDGRARLFILRDSLVERDQELIDRSKPFRTQDEFPGYIWAGGRKAADGKEQPVKEDDHGMDTVRYVVAHRDLGPQYPVGKFRVPGS